MSGEGLIAEPRAVHASVGHARLQELMHRGTEFLGCEVAIMGGAMSWVSERHLVSAISNAGGFGVIACGAMGPELLDAEIAETKARTTRPFGVNLITMHPQLTELIDICAQHKVGHVVLAGGLPPGGAIERIKASGARLVCFAPALALAKKLMRSGADALVIEGMEAGGHIGPVSTSVLAQEILPQRQQGYPGVRRRRHRSRRGDRGLSRNGRSRRPARHAVRLRDREHRPSELQEGVHPGLGARRDPIGADRPAPAGHSRPRTQEPRDGEFRRQAARGRRSGSTRARSKWPRPSCRSSIIGRARCAAR